MKQLILSVAVLAAAFSFSGNAAEPPSAAAAAPAKPAAAAPAKPAAATASPQVQVVTSLGSFTIELNAERAPLTVAQFLKYVDQGFYSGTIFHRAIPNFVIQGAATTPITSSRAAQPR